MKENDKVQLMLECLRYNIFIVNTSRESNIMLSCTMANTLLSSWTSVKNNYSFSKYYFTSVSNSISSCIFCHVEIICFYKILDLFLFFSFFLFLISTLLFFLGIYCVNETKFFSPHILPTSPKLFLNNSHIRASLYAT